MQKLILLSTIVILLRISDPVFPLVENGYMCLSDADTLYSVTGEWKFKYGDDIAWAKQNFDDSTWGTRVFPGWISPQPGKDIPGYFWYRLRFKIGNSAFKERPLFISIPRIVPAYEIFINGIRCGGKGRLPDAAQKWQWGEGGFYILLNPDQISATVDNVIAIRVYGGNPRFAGALYIYGFIGSYRLKAGLYWISNFYYYILGAIAFSLGLYHLVWFRYRGDAANSAFGICCICTGLWLFLIWLPDTIESPDTALIHSLYAFFNIATLPCMLATIYYLFYEVLVPLKKIFFSIIAMIAASALIGLGIGGHMPISLLAFTLPVGMLIIWPFVIFLGIMTFQRHRLVSGMLMTATSISALSILVDAVRNFVMVEIPLPHFLWMISPSSAAIFCILLSIAISRDRRCTDEKKKRPRSTTVLAGIDIPALHERLLSTVQQDIVYADETLTIQKLATLVSITPRQLSEFLNEHIGANFNTFINSHRIAAAMRLLVDEPDSSVLSIAYRVGFNTLSKFYVAFKAVAGTTPNGYRKDRLAEK